MFQNLIETVCGKDKFTPNTIHNVGEDGVTIVQ